MARKKRPPINLAQPVQPKTGDLASLFATDDDVEQASGLQLLAIRIDRIEPDPDQPRNTFPKESLTELSESIRQDGVIQPIEVTEMEGGRYLIVHGERRWRAAGLAGLTVMPAVVRRRNYDFVTRFVRQMVENIQREDLNDVDRAAGLLRLQSLMQEELEQGKAENMPADEPWGKKITWAKVGRRLGYSRQRIHQLISLLKLPDEIKDAVREGELSERETRIYQGLTASQQRALHQNRIAGALTPAEVKEIATQLKRRPDMTVAQMIRILRQPLPEVVEPVFDSSFEENDGEGVEEITAVSTQEWGEEQQLIPSRSGGLTNIERLSRVHGHLTRLQIHGITLVEQQEMLRLLKLIQRDVASLNEALSIDF